MTAADLAGHLATRFSSDGARSPPNQDEPVNDALVGVHLSTARRAPNSWATVGSVLLPGWTGPALRQPGRGKTTSFVGWPKVWACPET